ncbi:MAG: FAD-dependent oxidoreductase [Clostridiales bacterium]|jgi:thioredoxin reductase (NADPH)|nr:FAD-dependent oxidoreductase [Clostridiales bacterium]
MAHDDAIIIGGGPAGLTAAQYLARAGRRALLFERIPAGGQAGTLPKIVNYPGLASVSGYDLIETMTAQARSFGAQIRYEDVTAVDGERMTVTAGGSVYAAAVIVLAAGCKSKTLGLSGEDALAKGLGVSYCATCDGGFFRGKTVAVAGGGAKAESEAAYLKNVAAKVYLIAPRPPRVEGVVPVEGRVTGLSGSPLRAVTVENGEERRELDVDGLFIAAGLVPQTRLLARAAADEKGFILTDAWMRTSLPGIYAVGDIRQNSIRQIVTACSDGAIAAKDALRALAQKTAAGGTSR